jgi:hypothetical protein
MKFKYDVGTRVYYTGYLTKHRGFYDVAFHQTAAGKYMLCEDLHGNPDNQKILQLVQQKNILPTGFLVIETEDSATGHCSGCDKDDTPVANTESQQFCHNCGAAWETTYVLEDYEVDEPIKYEVVAYTPTYTCNEDNDDCPGGDRFRLFSSIPADTIRVGDHINFNEAMCRVSGLDEAWTFPSTTVTLYLHEGSIVTVPSRTKVNVYKH